MTRTEKYKEFHNSIADMVEDCVVQQVILNTEYLRQPSEKVIYASVINPNVLTFKTIDKYGMVIDYVVRHDNGKLQAVGFALQNNLDYTFYENII